ncbi:MAG: tRNA lysidine(34) synthetase TilS [Chlorobium sp.]|nr:tRNA lysidine(34) synthetase TilS [Chlorobium sp.]
MPRELNSIERKFLEQLTVRKLVSRREHVLAAVSGGPDSMALLYLLCAVRSVLKVRISVAHCNFQLRGEESELDEEFVRSECEKLGLECYVRRFDTQKDARRLKKSIEETARIERYGFFNELVAKDGFDRVATGHHVSDNAETVLFNLIRGSSISGLKGIRSEHGHVIRPLLLMQKRDITRYIGDKEISYRVDSSNIGIEPDRNFIRNKIIPLIEERFNNKLLPSLQRLSEHAGELEEFLELHFERIVREDERLALKDNRLFVPSSRKLTVFERKEIFKRALGELGCEYSSKALQQLAELLQTQPGRTVQLAAGLEILWKGEYLYFVKKSENSEQ